MIEVYLKENNDNILRFPITPSEVGAEGTSEINIEKVNRLGEVSIFGGKNLRTATLSGFFPNKKYSFCNYTDFKKPYEYVRMIEKWMYEGTKIRYIVADTHSNIQVMITSFDYKEQDGTRDVYYNISLTECIDIKINKTSQTNNNSNNNTNRPTENNPSSNKKMHKVVKGDSLWTIAQKYYSNGSKYPQIKEKNKAKYPSLSKNNIIYVGWELEL